MEFDEISLVTRPANQLSKVVLFKSDTVTEELMTTEVQTENIEESVEETEVEKAKKMPKMDVEMDEEEMDEMEKKKMKKDDDTIELPSEVYEYIEALEAANNELLEQVEKFAKAEEAQNDDIMKSADPRIVEIVKAAQDRAEAAEMIAKAERDFRLEREFVSKASTLTHLPIDTDEFGRVLKEIADSVSEETFSKVWQVLEAANENVSTGDTFKEIGKSTGFLNDGPASIIEKSAASLMKENPNLSREQAIAKAVENDPNLYIHYLREGK
jgi:hypothetical protein